MTHGFVAPHPDDVAHPAERGVFERHPDLRVVWTEMPGLRWAVEQLERATRQLQVVQSRFAARCATGSFRCRCAATAGRRSG